MIAFSVVSTAPPTGRRDSRVARRADNEAIGLSLLAAIGFGSAPIFARTAMQSFSFLPAVWMSLLVSFVISAVLALAFAHQDIGNLSVTAFLWILAVGVTHHVCGRPQNYLSVSIIGASRASLFFSSQAPSLRS